VVSTAAAPAPAAVADYVFGERKFGGNAQAITNKRWLHHTSFLWDFEPANMAALLNPAKQPHYRQVGQWLLLLLQL
jgi:lipoate-protein ligase A